MNPKHDKKNVKSSVEAKPASIESSTIAPNSNPAPKEPQTTPLPTPSQSRFKKWIKKPWVWILLIVLIGIGYAIYAGTRPVPPEIITVSVQRGTLVQTVEATGEVEAVDELELSFDASGTVFDVFVETGGLVEEGQVLAALETEELQADVDRALQAVSVAEGNLAQTLAGSTREEIASSSASLGTAEANVLAAEVELQNAKAERDADELLANAQIVQSETSLATAQQAMSDEIKESEQILADDLQDIVIAMKGAMVQVRDSISDADEVLAIDNDLANEDFDELLGILDNARVQVAENAYEDAKEARDLAENLIANLPLTAPEWDVNTALPKLNSALDATAELLLDTRVVLDATIGGTIGFSQADLAALEAKIDTSRSEIQAEQDALAGVQATLQASKIARMTAENAADDAIAQAQADLERVKADKIDRIALAESRIRNAEATLAIRQAEVNRADADLSGVKAGPRLVDIAAQEASVRQAKADLSAAEARLSNAQIIAPISGQVTDVKIDKGEQIGARTVAISMQSSGEMLQMKLEIPEADVAKVALDDKVDITFDAFDDDVVIKATVKEIDPAEVEIEGVIFYEALLSFSEEPPVGIRPGMTVDAEIETENLPNTLFLPQRAVLEREGRKFVRLPNGFEYEERDVEVGIRGDAGRLQILSGVSEGADIILTIREAQ